MDALGCGALVIFATFAGGLTRAELACLLADYRQKIYYSEALVN